jgi:hypothetical protein
MTREFTHDNRIARDEFLFWRFLGPTLIIGAGLMCWLIMSPHNLPLDRIHILFLGMLALGTAYVWAVLLQFDLLREKTVAALEVFCLAIPGLTYLFALGVDLAGDPSLLAFALVWLIFVSLILAETPSSLWRTRIVEAWSRDDPSK